MLVRFTNPSTKLPIYYRADFIVCIAHGISPLGTHLMTTIPQPGGYLTWVVQESVEEAAERINAALGVKQPHEALLRSQ